jgi:hypothetical protein
MNPITLDSLARNAFRILGLTADASQAQIDSAARRMRIWNDPAAIPPTANDTPWIGPVPRMRKDIEDAVARLGEPLSRLQERFCWFCQRPPDSDALPVIRPDSALALHDAALVLLHRGLLTRAEDIDPWQAITDRFRALSKSDDYRQWLMEVESSGDFEKRAGLDEITLAQQQMPLWLSSAVVASIGDLLEGGDYAAAARAVKLIGADDPRSAEKLLDRMGDDLAGRCSDLVNKIEAARETRQASKLRPWCNHAVARFDSDIQPRIHLLLSTTQNPGRQSRIRMHGVSLLTEISEAYEAFGNFLAAEHALARARQLAAGTSMEFQATGLLERVEQPRMVWIWRGAGLLVLVIVFGCSLVANIIFDATFGHRYYDNHKWPLALSLLVSAAVCWRFGRFLRKNSDIVIDNKTGEQMFSNRSDHSRPFPLFHPR